MTTSPPNLLAVRDLLRPLLGLTAVEMGIVGDAAHRGGYHQGRDRVGLDDYSVRQSPRDRAGLSEYASALDVGYFRITVRGKQHDLRSFSVWLVAQCRAAAADTRDIREIIYSPDGRTVRRWDRLGQSTTGDPSHLGHTHISYFRDATRDGRDLTGPYRRYLHEIGLWAGEDDDMAEASDIVKAWALGVDHTPDGGRVEPVKWRVRDEAWQARMEAQLAELAGRPVVDAEQVAGRLLAALTPEAIAAAIPDQLAEQVADKLAQRLAS